MKRFAFKLTFNRYDGIIARIALVTERRGFTIEQISINKCTDDYSCMNLVIEGEEAKFDQICKQLNKLVDIISLEVVRENVQVSVAA
jgi:acetolactate synthase I/III small subunit